jgi:hypothetical protein
MQLISSEIYPQLIDCINQNLVDRVDLILSAGLDGNNDIVCCVQRQNQQIKAIIEDESESIKFIELGEMESCSIY